ncbi:Prophage LambdaBa02, site-specific recombinase, phage integrase family [Alloactinosynnema sp. L-07]|uniref:tyrosine-type recombinase/integrase n=1 Tax=Alloactinosynnema sp. L-07 TaxID=1653480 RepID=UPI00065F0A9C|nr:site-specific integrase [Alloactinosynnema sp. L-07]CRK61947.1 Prophage LambdaBa02, site-specific recombinase, phage integrase family [Alloactinosynnema sp. L-07]
MAWVEQTGAGKWRVRYRATSGGSYRSVSGFRTRKAAKAYAEDMATDKRRGTWLDPAGCATSVEAWVKCWVDTLDVETRTEENYRGVLRNHILPHWGQTALSDISTLAVTAWLKHLRKDYAASTVATIRTVFSMLLDDAVDERLIPANPVRRRRRRGRRRDHGPNTRERVWAMPDHVVRIAAQATMLGGPSAGLLIITAAWTGCRWGELTGLQRDHVDLDQGTITIDPDTGTLHESIHQLYLGPPKTPASARTITLPRFLVHLLREHLAHTSGAFVFTTRRGCLLRRSTFDRRVLRPAADGDPRRGIDPIRPGLTFHGLRHSHKTWLIADHVPEIAQAKRLGHHLRNRLVEVYSHVAPEVETHLLRALERRWQRTAALRRPTDTRPHNRVGLRAPHTHPARYTPPPSRRRRPTPQVKDLPAHLGMGPRRKINAPDKRQTGAYPPQHHPQWMDKQDRPPSLFTQVEGRSSDIQQ